MNDIIFLVNLGILKDFPISLLPIIEQAQLLGDSFLLRQLLLMMRVASLTVGDGDLFMKYVEHQLARLSPRAKLTLIRWALKVYQRLEMNPRTRAKLYILAARTFLETGLIYRAQHYAFLALHELGEDGDDTRLRLNAYIILASVFTRRGFIRYSKRFLIKALSLLEKRLTDEQTANIRYDTRLLMEVLSIALRRMTKFFPERELLRKMLATVNDLEVMQPTWKYLDPDITEALGLKLLELIGSVNLEDSELRKQVYDTAHKLLYYAKLSEYNLIAFKNYFIMSLYKVWYLELANVRDEAFKLLKSLFFTAKYQLMDWSYLLIAKYNMFRVLYNAQLESELANYLKEIDVEKYIKREELKYPTKLELWHVPVLGGDGIATPPFHYLLKRKPVRNFLQIKLNNGYTTLLFLQS